jgi:hypothetical protein
LVPVGTSFRATERLHEQGCRRPDRGRAEPHFLIGVWGFAKRGCSLPTSEIDFWGADSADPGLTPGGVADECDHPGVVSIAGFGQPKRHRPPLAEPATADLRSMTNTEAYLKVAR